MDYSQWIGTDARKLPDGSVAVVKYLAWGSPMVRMSVGGKLFFVDSHLQQEEEYDGPSPATVIAIIKLGEEKPKTLADVPKYEAWGNECGTLGWKDRNSEMCYSMDCIAIIKLGEERPADFSQVSAYEAWENECGTLHWKDRDGEMCYLLEDGLPEVNYPREPKKHPITTDMHRVGMVTGILVDGKPWPHNT